MRKSYWFEVMVLLAVATISLCFMFFTTKVFAGGVTDDNNGNKGYILVSTGQNQGANSEGHWTNPSCIPELKGDKGDTGDNGQDGNDGYTPIKRVDYFDGTNGIDGEDGLDGINGLDGKDGLSIKGDTGDTGVGEPGKDGKDGANGKDGKNIKGDKGKQGEIGKGLKDRQELQLEIRLRDTRKTGIFFYFIHDFNNDNNTAGIKFLWKLGTSYEEREIAKTNARLANIEKILNINTVITKTVDEQGNLKSITIH